MITMADLIQETQAQWFNPKRILVMLLTVDGNGSLLDADTLDGAQLAALARLASANTFTASQTISGAAQGLKIVGNGTSGDASIGYIGFYDSDGVTRRGYVGDASASNDDIYLQADTGDLRLGNSSGASRLVLAANVAQFIGTIQTALGVTWDVGGYTAGAPAATGYVTVKVAGTTYKLLAST